jgi:acetoin utilization deacetylase AcuC-like enzyme
MRAFYHPAQAAHAPVSEMHNGGFVPYQEHGGRVESVLAAIGPVEQPRDYGIAPIAAVHRQDYLDFLRTAYGRWREAGRAGDALPYVWPVVGRRTHNMARIDALLGRYSFDATTPIAEHSWTAALASAHTALAATEAVLEGEPAAFALCRPPGHHAGADYYGGYCYLNVAAIAAQWAAEATGGRVAILDIDYHHGNGTQDIFWDRGDIFYASIHADPATDYPFYWGHADERGEGAGAGATLNLPLPHGADFDAYRQALAQALAAIAAFRPAALILSFGADTYFDDPICNFRLTTEDFRAMAALITECGWPTAILLEGGYATEMLGANVASFLSGF